MKSHCICISFIATLLLLRSEAHVHKHHIRYAQTHHPHSHLNNILNLRHTNSVGNETSEDNFKNHIGLNKEIGKCQFPSDAGLIPITPHAKNAGWAMAPDEQCSPGSYCPYACPSGKVMAQWNPNAKAYTYPQSMDGGLFCNQDGQVSKPFPEKPYCVPGTGGVGAHNKIGKGVSFCQTVLPGGESMLIPTHVEDMTELAVPGTNYWCKTAAHYYINPPGVSVEEACVWGDPSKPVGNWSPYVAGANTDESGQTFVKVGWNPIFTGSALSSTPPQFGVKITCDGGGCNGTPCAIDPAVGGVGNVQSATKSTGAGGADFCVVTVPKGSRANIEVFSAGAAHDTNGDKSPTSSKTLPSSSSTSIVKAPTSTPAVSKNLGGKSENSLDNEITPSPSSPELMKPSIASTSSIEEEISSSDMTAPEFKEELDVDANMKPKIIPTQEANEEISSITSTPDSSKPSRPDHLFDEPSTNIPDAKNNDNSNHSAPNRQSTKPALFETESEMTYMASAGTEHSAATTGDSISGSAQQTSLATMNRVCSPSIRIQICLLFLVYIFFY